jgi:hypothetical protein
MFGNFELKRSKITSPPVCAFTQYRIPVFVIRSLEINGNDAARDEVTALLTIPISSKQIGRFAVNQLSIL